MHLRSVELVLPDPKGAHDFLCGTWGAVSGEVRGESYYVRGSGDLPYLVGLSPAQTSSIQSTTFSASESEIAAVEERAGAAGIDVVTTTSTDPGGGTGILIVLPGGACFRLLAGSETHESLVGADIPVRLTHVVLNASDAEREAKFCEDILGFRVSDRTVGMAFVRCNESHHSIAFARAGFDSLNHIAFEMADLDAVMRGMGRMRDAGFEPAWGPGRHGPGANVFAYYVAPFGAVVEFSTAVVTVSDDYRVGGLDDWTWPAGRIDQWGVSDKNFDALRIADRNFLHGTRTIACEIVG